MSKPGGDCGLPVSKALAAEIEADVKVRVDRFMNALVDHMIDPGRDWSIKAEKVAKDFVTSYIEKESDLMINGTGDSEREPVGFLDMSDLEEGEE